MPKRNSPLFELLLKMTKDSDHVAPWFPTTDIVNASARERGVTAQSVRVALTRLHRQGIIEKRKDRPDWLYAPTYWRFQGNWQDRLKDYRAWQRREERPTTDELVPMKAVNVKGEDISNKLATKKTKNEGNTPPSPFKDADRYLLKIDGKKTLVAQVSKDREIEDEHLNWEGIRKMVEAHGDGYDFYVEYVQIDDDYYDEVED